MIKVIVLHPNADTKYNREQHLEFTKALPGLRRFTVNETMADPLTGQKPPYNLVNEVYFDDIEAYKAAFTSPEVKRAIADVANFSDFSVVIQMVSVENDIPLSPRTDSPKKARSD